MKYEYPHKTLYPRSQQSVCLCVGSLHPFQTTILPLCKNKIERDFVFVFEKLHIRSSIHDGTTFFPSRMTLRRSATQIKVSASTRVPHRQWLIETCLLPSRPAVASISPVLPLLPVTGDTKHVKIHERNTRTGPPMQKKSAMLNYSGVHERKQSFPHVSHIWLPVFACHESTLPNVPVEVHAKEHLIRLQDMTVGTKRYTIAQGLACLSGPAPSPPPPPMLQDVNYTRGDGTC